MMDMAMKKGANDAAINPLSNFIISMLELHNLRHKYAAFFAWSTSMRGYRECLIFGRQSPQDHLRRDFC
jgi:hypothetical protein